MKYLFTALLFNIVNILTSNAQWFCNGPSGGSITCHQMVGNTLYVGTSNGVFKSTDGGNHYTAHSKNLPQAWISQLYFDGTTMYVGLSQKGVYISSDTGINFSSSSTGMGIPYQFDYPFVEHKGKVYSNNVFGTFYTTNHGQSWTQMTLPSYLTGYFLPMFSFGNTLLKVAHNSSTHTMYKSIDGGSTWIIADTGITEKFIKHAYSLGDTLFLFTNQRVYTSMNGTNWKMLTKNPFKIGNSTIFQPGSLCYDGTYFYGAQSGNASIAICKISPKDTQWQLASNQYPDKGYSYAMYAIGNKVFSCLNGILFSTTNQGGVWVPETNSGLNALELYTVFASGNTIFAGADATAYYSKDAGLTWQLCNTNFNGYVTCFEDYNGVMFAGGSGIFQSTDNGVNWTGPKLQTIGVSCIKDDGTYIYAGGVNNSSPAIYRSSDGGKTWVNFNKGIPSGVIIDLLPVGNKVFACFGSMTATDQGVYVSDNSTDNWTLLDKGLDKNTPMSLAYHFNVLYAGTDGKGVYQSTDLGANWSPINTGIEKTYVKSLTTLGFDLFAATDSGVFVLRHGSTVWQNITYNLRIKSVTKLSANADYVYAATDGGSVWQILRATVGIKPTDGPMNSFDAFPNPANQLLEIHSKDFKYQDEIRITDAKGQLIDTIMVLDANAPIKINTSTYSNGIYFIQIIGANGMHTQKCVVQH